ncbi:MAG: hypothetical protein RR763_08685 [Massilia sp.]
MATRTSVSLFTRARSSAVSWRIASRRSLGSGAQRVEAFAVGGDGVFGGLGIGLRRRGGSGVDGRTLIGQRTGACFGVVAALGRHIGLGFRLDTRDRFLDFAHFEWFATRTGKFGRFRRSGQHRRDRHDRLRKCSSRRR